MALGLLPLLAVRCSPLHNRRVKRSVWRAREASERGVVPGEVRQAERIFRQRGIVGFEETEAGEAVFEVTREAARNIAERGEEIRQGLTDIGVSLTETDRLIRGVADTEVPQEQFLAIVDFLNTLRREGFTRGEVFLAAEQFATGTEGERIAGIILSGAGDRLAQAAADLVRQPTFRTAAEEEALRQSFAGRGRVETLLEEIREQGVRTCPRSRASTCAGSKRPRRRGERPERRHRTGSGRVHGRLPAGSGAATGGETAVGRRMASACDVCTAPTNETPHHGRTSNRKAQLWMMPPSGTGQVSIQGRFPGLHCEFSLSAPS